MSFAAIDGAMALTQGSRLPQEYYLESLKKMIRVLRSAKPVGAVGG